VPNATEHQIELREAEDERVALVDERDVDLVAHRLGQDRAELQPAEARAKDDDAFVHRFSHYRVPLGCGTIRM
jgi:hypothetical protein